MAKTSAIDRARTTSQVTKAPTTMAADATIARSLRRPIRTRGRTAGGGASMLFLDALATLKESRAGRSANRRATSGFYRPSAARRSRTLDDHRDRVATAQAQGREAAFRDAVFHRVDERREHARAAAADGMA